MNKRQVLILWVIAIALAGAVTAVKLSQKQSTDSATKRSAGETLFESFPATDVSTVEVQGTADSVTLTKKDGKWVVSQRDDYPANSTFVNDLIRTLGELKVTVAMEAGPSFAPRFGMDESSAVAEDRGLTATFKDAAGKEVAKVSLGKNIENTAAPSPMMMGAGNAVGRYVRNHADESGFYAVSEMFPSVSTEPNRWLADGFISPEKIKSITISQPDKEAPAWMLTRDDEEAEFKLAGATPTEVLDTTATSPLKTLFSYSRFEDVVPKDKVAERSAAEGKQTATIETFEGFTYTVTITATKPAAAPPAALSANMPPPATDNYLLTVSVTAELPKERKKEADEKPEDAKTKDEAFTTRLKSLTEKLEKEKALAGRTFEVTKSLIEPLLKERAALITQATPPPAAEADTGNVQQLPGGLIAKPPVTATTPPIEAVTPPISIPAQEDEDAADADDEDDYKAEEE
ncbi:MAG: DUF4340 domain-containing protein [Akkermansiaceae bacterium]